MSWVCDYILNFQFTYAKSSKENLLVCPDASSIPNAQVSWWKLYAIHMFHMYLAEALWMIGGGPWIIRIGYEYGGAFVRVYSLRKNACRLAIG